MSYEDVIFDHSHQLHPAFAGYLHDGCISERDALAAIFHLLKTGSLDPIWQDNNMHRGLVGLRIMKRVPKYNFEKIILKKIFLSKKTVTTKEVGALIRQGQIQDIIKKNTFILARFPLIQNKLKFRLGKNGSYQIKVNDNLVDSLEEANEFSHLLHRWLLPIFTLVSVLLIGVSLFLPKAGELPRSIITPNFSFQQSGDTHQLALVSFLIGSVSLLVCLYVYFTFSMAQKIVFYDFQKDVLPLVKQEYIQLFALLKNLPLQKKSFTNEYLPFAIAFGLDNSWQKDFGLDSEIAVDQSPIMGEWKESK